MPDSMHLPVAILAGGLATRLQPLTLTIPKVLLEVAGKPFLEHQLVQLREQGVDRVVLCVGFLGEVIEERYGDGRAFGIHLDYSFDGARLLGTGGAIRNALPLLGDAFFVMYGDSYLRIGFREVARIFQHQGKAGLMTLFHNRGLWDSSNVCSSDGVIQRYDKVFRDPAMQHIDYGLSVFRADVFSAYPADEVFDLSRVMRDLVKRGEMAGFEAQERFYEIGSREGLCELNDWLIHSLQCEEEVV